MKTLVYSIVCGMFVVGLGCSSEGHLEKGKEHSPCNASERLPCLIVCERVVLIRIPHGERVIGTAVSKAYSSDKPSAILTIDYPIYIGQTEVTTDQFCNLMGEKYRKRWKPTEARVVTWEQAMAYCDEFGQMLSAQMGVPWHCRLPYEAEWEYAARYGRPAWEDWWPTWSSNYAGWWEDNSKGWTVALHAPNPLGLYDMLGNVWEWCGDYWEEDVEMMLEHGPLPSYPKGPKGKAVSKEDSFRPTRGGNYGASCPDDLRPSRRSKTDADLGTGFRIVVLPGPAPKTPVVPWKWRPIVAPTEKSIRD
jgi:formylglycine-generating enzyme required for sulfatase activity